VNGYQWLVKTQHIPPSRIIIGGDSAGGNASIMTCLRLRDMLLQMPRAMLLISPWYVR
jgi:acetyl esterase/lipase